MKRHLTLEEISAYTGIAVRTLRWQCAHGRIKARKRGKRWIVDLADLLQRNGFEELAEEIVERQSRQ
jgi:hypothetical protein